MITGKLTRMRPIEPKDLGFIQDLANDRHVAGHVVGWMFPVSEHSQLEWLQNIQDAPNSRRFLVEDLKGTPLGISGLWDIDWQSRRALTATKLYAPHITQKGMGTDSIKTLMAYAFYDVGLNRLWGSILDFNGPSFGAYVKKCGWKVEGVLRQEVLRKGEFCDLYRVAILKSEFDALDDARDYVDLVMPINISEKVEVPHEWWAPGACTGGTQSE